jgi:hypothetical protein
MDECWKHLPNELVSYVLNTDELPIDTYLALKKHIYMKRKKRVYIDDKVKAFLNKMFTRRTHIYEIAKKSILQSSNDKFECLIKRHVDDSVMKVVIHIYTYSTGDMQIDFHKTHQGTFDTYTRLVCDMHTGKTLYGFHVI